MSLILWLQNNIIHIISKFVISDNYKYLKCMILFLLIKTCRCVTPIKDMDEYFLLWEGAKEPCNEKWEWQVELSKKLSITKFF